MGTFYAQYPAGAAGAANPSVGTNGAVAPASSTEIGGINPSGDLQPLQTDASGNLFVALADPTGLATAANQVTQIGLETSIDTATTSLDGKTVHVDTDDVTVVASALPTGASTEAKQDAQIVLETSMDASLTSIDSKLTSPLAVTGPLTDTQLRAAPVPVSGTVSTGGLTDAELRASAVPVSLTSTTITGSVAVTGPLTDTELRATPVPVSGTVSTGGLTDAELRASAVPVSLTSTTITGSVAVTAASLPLPTGAATESTLGSFSAKSMSAMINNPFDEVVITYVGATTRIDTVVYKLATVTVNTLTMSYDGSDRLDGVVKT